MITEIPEAQATMKPDAQSAMSPEEISVVSMTLRLVCTVLIVAGNILILVVIRKSRHFRPVTRLLIGHLAVCDMLFGLMLILHAMLLATGTLSYPACLVIIATGTSGGLTSCVGICLVFLDNYMSLRNLNATTATGMSLRQAWMAIGGGWAGTISIGAVFISQAPRNPKGVECVYGGGAFTSLSLALSYIPMLVFSFILLLLMLLALYAVQKGINAVMPAPENNPPPLQPSFRQQHMKRVSKIVRLFAIIAVGFFISWLPLAILLCVIHVCPDCDISNQTVRSVLSLTLLNASVNMIVYIIKDNNFRKELLKRFRCKKKTGKKRGTNAQSPNTVSASVK